LTPKCEVVDADPPAAAAAAAAAADVAMVEAESKVLYDELKCAVCILFRATMFTSTGATYLIS